MLFGLLSLGALQAQTGVDITFAGDSMSGVYCPSPVWTYLSVSGTATNYNQLTDTAEIYINFGDGHDTTFMQPLWGQSPNLNFWGGADHIYNSSGAYTVLYAVLMPDGETDTLVVPNEGCDRRHVRKHSGTSVH